MNYELPNVPETYVHRIGRTGRAGRSGIAISFCNYDELAYLKDIEKLIRKKIPVVEDHPWPMEILEATPKAARPPRPSRGERGSTAKPAAARAARPARTAPVKQPVERPVQAPEKRQRPAPRQEQKAQPIGTVRLESVAALPIPAGVPVPVPRPIRRISSEPQQVGRVVAFADGRRNRRRRNHPKG